MSDTRNGTATRRKRGNSNGKRRGPNSPSHNGQSPQSGVSSSNGPSQSVDDNVEQGPMQEAKEEATKNNVKMQLDKRIGRRPSRADLVGKNIIKAYAIPGVHGAGLHGAMHKLEKTRAEDKLKQLLANRESLDDLRKKQLLPEKGLGVNVSQARKQLQKAQEKQRLSDFLEHRPTLEQIVEQKRNLVEDTMTWTREVLVGMYPLPRNCHSMTAIGDKLYLLGGYGSQRSADLLVCDTNTFNWSRPMIGGIQPDDRYSHACVSVGHTLILFGGFSMGSNRWMNDCHFLDTEYVQEFYPPTAKKHGAAPQRMLMWYEPEFKGTPPAPRAAHTCTAVGTKVYVFGGNDGNSFFNDLHVLDTESLEWTCLDTTGAVPSPRAGHTTVAVGDKKHQLVVFGGGTATGGTNKVHVLDLDTLVWSQPEVRGTPPHPRAGHTAVASVNSCMLVFGGGHDRKWYNDLHMCDLANMQWTRPSDSGVVPIPRAGHTCNIIGKKMFVFGGGDQDVVFNDMHVLDTAFLLLPRRKSIVDSESGLAERSASDDDASLSISAKEAREVVNRISLATTHIYDAIDATKTSVATKQADMVLKEHHFHAMLKSAQETRKEQFEALKQEIEHMEQHVMKELASLKDALSFVVEKLEAKSGMAPTVSRMLSHGSSTSSNADRQPSPIPTGAGAEADRSQSRKERRKAKKERKETESSAAAAVASVPNAARSPPPVAPDVSTVVSIDAAVRLAPGSVWGKKDHRQLQQSSQPEQPQQSQSQPQPQDPQQGKSDDQESGDTPKSADDAASDGWATVHHKGRRGSATSTGSGGGANAKLQKPQRKQRVAVVAGARG